jgi:signal transduction histidine kinase
MSSIHPSVSAGCGPTYADLVVAAGAMPAEQGGRGLGHPEAVSATPLKQSIDVEPRRSRSRRDWVVDVTSVALSAGLGSWFLVLSVQNGTSPSTARLAVDAIFGGISCIALWFRRRFPVGVAVLTAVLSVVSVSTSVAATIAMFTVAVHRRAGTALAIGALNVATGALFFALRSQSIVLNARNVPVWVPIVTTSAILAAITSWGMLVRTRRQLVLSLRERVERAEAAQRLLADQARLAERARIAREMHDVVAHRVSLMALHAGALQMRPDLPAAEVGQTAGLIRSTAREAMEELADVIGVLRADGSAEPSPQLPQPTLADVKRLVEDSRRAGASVDLTMDVADPEHAPGALGRDAYRIVQEALTNVNKHAPGTATHVTVSGGPGRGLRVMVRNRLPLAGSSASSLPGSGMGLVGLRERVALSGGSLQHGPTASGEFQVCADLNWPP